MVEYFKGDINKADKEINNICMLLELDSDSEVNIIDLANIEKKFNSKRIDINWGEKYDYYGDGIIDIYALVKI